MKYEGVMKIYKKYIEPFFVLVVILMLYLVGSNLVEYNNLQEKIANNCGWEDETTRCYCEKEVVIQLEGNEMQGDSGDLNITIDINQ